MTESLGEKEQSTITTVEPRTGLQLLGDRSFGTLMLSKTLYLLALWIYAIVAAIAVFQSTGSATLVSLVSVVQFIPQILFAPMSGRISDLGSTRTQIWFGYLISGTGVAALTPWLWIEGEPGIWVFVASSFIIGLGIVTQGPAMQAAPPTVVAREELPTAMAVNSVPMTISRSCGPAIGAVIATLAEPGVAFLVSAILYLVCAASVFIVRLPAAAEPEPDDDRSLRATIRYLRNHHPLLLLILMIAALGMGAEPAITLAPAIADALGASAGLSGWLASAFGLGAFLGLFLLRPTRTLFGSGGAACLGTAAMGLGALVAAFLVHPAVPLVGAGIQGAAFTVALTSTTTLIQEQSPAAMRGRIMALWFLSFLAARPLGSIVSGISAEFGSAAIALTITAVVLLGCSVVCRPERLRPPSDQKSPCRAI